MQSRIIFIVVGLVLVFSVGIFVYETKQPVILSPEDLTTPTPSLTPLQQTPISVTPTPISQTPRPKIPTPTPWPATPTPTPPTLTPIPTPTPSGITYAQIAMHNSRSSCWSAINGSVYDLTSWIPNHPGGENTILSICGKDGSGAYSNQHGDSSRVARILVGFKIGNLAQ